MTTGSGSLILLILSYQTRLRPAAAPGGVELQPGGVQHGGGGQDLDRAGPRPRTGGTTPGTASLSLLAPPHVQIFNVLNQNIE